MGEGDGGWEILRHHLRCTLPTWPLPPPFPRSSPEPLPIGHWLSAAHTWMQVVVEVPRPGNRDALRSRAPWGLGASWENGGPVRPAGTPPSFSVLPGKPAGLNLHQEGPWQRAPSSGFLTEQEGWVLRRTASGVRGPASQGQPGPLGVTFRGSRCAHGGRNEALEAVGPGRRGPLLTAPAPRWAPAPRSSAGSPGP